MGTAVGTFSGRTNHQIRLETQLASQSIDGNYSTVNWQLYAEKTATSSSYYLTAGGGGSVTINGQVISIAAWSYDFRTNTIYTLGTGTVNIAHNADGTQTETFSASVTAPGTLGSASCSGSEVLPTIPRATTPTLSPTSGDTDSAYTIGHSAASSSFYHDIFYSLDAGASYVNIATNIAATITSTSWTPASSLFPSSAGGTIRILLRTRASSSGTIIGDKTIDLPVTVPSTVVPTISSVAWVDSQTTSPDMPTLMGAAGRFVQKWSKLKPTVTSAGAAGSTITGTSVVQNGQSTSSGVAFGAPIDLSGTTPFSATATDSRGRSSATYSNTVPVTAYNYPNLPTPLVARTSDSAGATPSPTGTYIAITPAASVSSLLFGTVEKNLLEWQVRIKPFGGSYTTVQAWTAASVSGTTWTTKYVAGGGYASSTEYVVEVSIRDLFGKGGFQTGQTVKVLEILVPSEAVFLDYNSNIGVGIGKYHASGMLDVAGSVFSNNQQLSGYFLARGSFTSASPMSAFPYGSSVMLSEPESGYPESTVGTLNTIKVWSDGGSIQYWSKYSAGTDVVWFRQAYYPGSTWTQWATVGGPAGQVTQFAGNAAPPGHLLCQGQAISRTAYARLYSVCGTHYGAGDGSTTFNLPNLSGRVPVGIDTSQAEFNGIGKTGGEKTHLLTTAEMPAHSHQSANGVGSFLSTGTGPNNANWVGTGASFQYNPNTAAAGGGGAHNNLQPYISLYYIIKY